MNAPMIVVQGDLLLPSLNPLGNQSVTFGRDWLPSCARPALSEYEIPFYAARLFTRYVSAVAFREDPFPYTPANLWGKFTRTQLDTREPQAAHFPATAEPAPPAFEPSTARAARRPAQPAKPGGRRLIAGGAIALACAAFIAWLMFGQGHAPEHQSRDEFAQPRIAQVSPSATAAKPAVASVVTMEAQAESAIAKITRPAQQNKAITGSVGLPDRPAVPKTDATGHAETAARAKPAATLAGKAKSRSAASAADEVYPAASRASKSAAKKAAREARQAGIGQTVPGRRNEKPKSGAQSGLQSGLQFGLQSESSAAAATRATSRALSADSRIAGAEPSYRSAARPTPRQYDAPPNQRAADRQMSVAEMYSLLQHSPTLDDNSSRTQPAAHGRADSADTANGNVRLSKQRITDAPADFTK
jgi:hypothetical protein